MVDLSILVTALTAAMVLGYALFFARGRRLRRLARQLEDVQQRLAVLDQRENARQQMMQRIYGPEHGRRFWIVNSLAAPMAGVFGWLLGRLRTPEVALAGSAAVLAGTLGVAGMQPDTPDPPESRPPPATASPTPSPSPTPSGTTRPPEPEPEQSTKPAAPGPPRKRKYSPQPTPTPTPTTSPLPSLPTVEPSDLPSLPTVDVDECLPLLNLEACIRLRG